MTRRTGLLLAATLLALVVFSGVALAATISCVAGVECLGTTQADTMNGSDGQDFIFGRGSGDTLKGFGINDFLYGQGGSDKLFGGFGGDLMIGGPGNDTLSGEEDSDRYYFGDGWGKDTITDNTASSEGSSPAENVLAFTNGPRHAESVPATDDLTVKLASGEGPEVKNASATSTINWEANAIQHVFSGSGDDHITGNYSANVIWSGPSDASSGVDSISTGGGNDVIHVDDGVGDDVVNCGESFTPQDNDEVYFDSGDQIASDCETKRGPA
jgi:Ca2+-binding RTX toxin-like protein